MVSDGTIFHDRRRSRRGYSTMREDDTALDDLVKAIIAGDAAGVSHRLAALPGLARARFDKGATRQDAQAFFLKPIERYIVAGDTALHIAAAAYQAGIARELIRSGAHVAAENRFGDQLLHAAALGNPNSPRWNPPAQVATIECLIEAGADPNAADKRGVTPLHKAVRTRCAPAVRSLLAHGANPELRNK